MCAKKRHETRSKRGEVWAGGPARSLAVKLLLRLVHVPTNAPNGRQEEHPSTASTSPVKEASRSTPSGLGQVDVYEVKLPHGCWT